MIAPRIKNDEKNSEDEDKDRFVTEIYYPNSFDGLDTKLTTEDDEEMVAKKMYWEPVVENTDPLPKRLRWILKDELKQTLDKNGRTVWVLTVDNLEFLKGVASAEIEGAAKLYAALLRHKFINLVELEDDEL
jgi:hypothetical protein